MAVKLSGGCDRCIERQMMYRLELVLFFPNSDGKGSWSFSLLPNVEMYCDADSAMKAIQFSWLFWGISLTKREVQI